jgi:hypothetical protein
MRNIWLIIIVAVILAGIARAAEKSVDFSGIWTLDPAHSKLWHTRPGLPKPKITIGNTRPDNRDTKDDGGFLNELPETRIQNLTLTIAQTDGEVRTMRQFTIDGEKRSVVQKFLLDGSQCINVASNGQGEFVSRTRWSENKLISSGSQTTIVGEHTAEMPAEEEYSISGDGKKLTIETSIITPRGVTHLKHVFTKEREAKP